MMERKHDLLSVLLQQGLVLFLLVVWSGMFVCMVEGEEHYHDFILQEKNFTRICVTKSMLVVNGQFPGPTLYIRKGDTVFVNVQNKGDYGVTIHWHGVKQPRNPWSDGPEYVTQCLIEPGSNFTYEVIFSIEEGTLWWHAHSAWTRNTVHGAIVIAPSEGTTYPFPKPEGEQVLILGSWYDFDVNLLVEEDLETGSALPESTSYLMNGQPGDFLSCSKDTTFRWSVDYGNTYLLRIVNAVMNTELFFEIAGHNLTVVGMDGSYLKPLVTRYIMIAAGQTMDVLVTTNQSSLGQYYMAARHFKSEPPTFTDYDHTNTTAILQYNHNGTDPNTSYPIFPDSLPIYSDKYAGYGFINQLKSLASEAHPVNVPMNITTHMFITLSINLYHYHDNGTVKVSLGSSANNISYVNTEIDVLQAYYRNMSDIYTEDFPDYPPTFFNFTADGLRFNTTQPLRGTKVKVVNYNEEVEMVFQSTNVLNGSVDHPMHLHGHSFYLVGFGSGNFDPVLDPLGYNLVDPAYVNTATAPRNGWVAIRFKANNPGVWLWHCHFDRHLSWGMNSVLIVRNGDTLNSTMRDPPPDMPSCKASSNIILPHESFNTAEAGNYI